QAGGTPVQVAGLIPASPEVAGRSGDTNVSFLETLYQDGLDRPLDATGRDAWGQDLTSGVGRADVVAAIFAGDEFRTNQVAGYYHQFLARTAEPAGLATWFGVLKQGST